MHPLLSKSSNMGAETGKPLITKGENAAKSTAAGSLSTPSGIQKTSTAARSFQHFFEVDAKNAEQSADAIWQADDHSKVVVENPAETPEVGDSAQNGEDTNFVQEVSDDPTGDGAVITSMIQITTKNSGPEVTKLAGAKHNDSNLRVENPNIAQAVRGNSTGDHSDLGSIAAQADQINSPFPVTANNSSVPYHFGWSIEHVDQKSIQVPNTDNRMGSQILSATNRSELTRETMVPAPPAPISQSDITQTNKPKLSQKSDQILPAAQSQIPPEQQSLLRTAQVSLAPSTQQSSFVDVGQKERSFINENRVNTGNPFIGRSSLAQSSNAAISALHPNSSNNDVVRAALETQISTQLRSLDTAVHQSFDTTNAPVAADPARANMPVHIARQLAEVAQHVPTRPVDITLSPEELGRVRMSVTPSENSIVVNILAERSETLDLMRRHIDQLTQEFKSLGYENIRFSFSQADDQASDDPDKQSTKDDAQGTDGSLTADTAQSTHIHLTSSATTGLDLRL